MGTKNMILWLKVSNDEYELPEAVADTSVELSRMCGLSKDAVQTAISKAKKRKTRCKYIKVEIENEEKDDG